MLDIMGFHIIAEIGSNWEGNVELGKEFIKKASEAGADSVKFQMWRAGDLYDESHPSWNEIKESELTEHKAVELKKYADQLGIDWFCSVFYPESIDILEKINVKFYKIASRTSTLKDKFAVETIEKLSLIEKPIFISTGEGANKIKIAELLKNKKFEFTYCVSKYPTKDDEIDWKQILNYNFFSDHTLGITIPIVFGVLKNGEKNNIFIEKHVKLESSKGPDAEFSISFSEMSELVSHLRRIEKLNIISG